MVTVSPYAMKMGKVMSVVEMALDITKTISLEKELKRIRDFQETVLNNATDGIIASDEDDIITIYNPAAQKILQYPFEALVGKKEGKELYPPDFVDSMSKGICPVILQESKIRNYRGKEIPVILSGTQLKKRSGKIVGTVIFFHDLRDIKRLEQEVLDAERLAAVGQTVAGLSHGIKNILMGLEGGVYVVNSGMKKNDNDLISQGWHMIQNNITKISSFTKEFLGFARGSTPQVEHIDPLAIAKDVADLYGDVTRQSNIRFKTNFQQNVEKAFMDSKGIHTCLSNLISNAIDACLMSDTETPEIDFSFFEKEGVICYEVKDNGCGMDYDIKKKIFTNFFTTKGSGQGTGLGLLTTRKIVQEHGGTISFTSSPGTGSVFRIELVRHRLPVPQKKDTVS
jgi:PAS domain S-box-containing protein